MRTPKVRQLPDETGVAERARLHSLRSQSCRTIDKFPWHPESFRQMRSERFYAEHFRRVMSAEQKIHAEFFGGNCSPVRRFAGDKRVDVFLCHPVNLRARGPGHDADRARLFRTEIENFYRTIQRLLQFPNEFTYAAPTRADFSPTG